MLSTNTKKDVDEIFQSFVDKYGNLDKKMAKKPKKQPPKNQLY